MLTLIILYVIDEFRPLLWIISPLLPILFLLHLLVLSTAAQCNNITAIITNNNVVDIQINDEYDNFSALLIVDDEWKKRTGPLEESTEYRRRITEELIHDSPNTVMPSIMDGVSQSYAMNPRRISDGVGAASRFLGVLFFLPPAIRLIGFS